MSTKTTENKVQTSNSIDLTKLINIEKAKQKVNVQKANAHKECVKLGITVRIEVADKYTKTTVTEGHGKLKFKAKTEWELEGKELEMAIKYKARYEKWFELSKPNNLENAIEVIQSLMD